MNTNLFVSIMVAALLVLVSFIWLYDDYKKNKKVSIGKVVLFIVVLFFSIWDTINRYSDSNRATGQILDTVSTTGIRVIEKVDTGNKFSELNFDTTKTLLRKRPIIKIPSTIINTGNSHVVSGSDIRRMGT